MKQFSELSELVDFSRAASKRGSLALVPTMGAFHAGHLSLMKQAKAACDQVIVSVFVNPLQFGPKEDFAAYPRTLDQDRDLAASVGVDAFWIPTQEALFPEGFQTQITVRNISHSWEGASRPSHFQGVATIVAKLLQLVRPDTLYLGQKDYQQCCVIRQMLKDLHFETKLKTCDIVREADGLAMSSRNRRLSATERPVAALIYKALLATQSVVDSGEREAQKLCALAKEVLLKEEQINIDYVALCDPHSLQPLTLLHSSAILLIALQLGSVRLIDNMMITAPGSL